MLRVKALKDLGSLLEMWDGDELTCLGKGKEVRKGLSMGTKREAVQR